MLLWLDLETTGLDPIKNRILEVAWLVTDSHLQPATDAIETRLIEPSLEAWDQLEEFNLTLPMHIDSGLYDDLLGHSTELSSLQDVEQEIIDSLQEMDGQPVFLAGASVHFDLAFLRHWMPRLAEVVSHRVYDTSTLKAFFHEFLEIPAEIKNENQHRAADDVLYVVRVANYYRNAVGEIVQEAMKTMVTQ